MPLYEFRCKKCGHHFEKIQSFSAPDPKACPVCGGKVERLISAPSFRFKGTGWYVTDFANEGTAKAAIQSPNAVSTSPAAASTPETPSAAPASTPAAAAPTSASTAKSE